MSDLISRSELIKVLKDRATNEAIMGYMTAYDVTNSIIDEVEEQPTAYDIDKDDVSDDMCEWRITDTKKLMPYKTSCDNEDLYDNSYKYCPYCGKKIKVVVE